MERNLHIQPLNAAAMTAARQRQAQLAKPPGSLGRLEELSVQLAGITGKVHNKIQKKHLLVFAADNGVVAEGVSSAPQSVTLMQTINLTRHKTGASTLCKHFGCDITVCDVGVNADIKEPKVLNRKIAYGTQNIVHGPAMTREQAEQAIIIGYELAKATDADVIGIGEMGIGNTTTSSAVLSVLLDADVDGVTGRGGGIDRRCELAMKDLNADTLARICESIGGESISSNADIAYRIPFLPQFPVTLKIWLPDEEFPASGRMLLDTSADHYLTIEDAVTVAEIILERITTTQ